MNRALIILGVFVAAGVVTWFFPLFHVVSRSSLQSAQAEGKFDAADFVEAFWSDKLMPALPEADDAVVVLAALRANPDQARAEFGRTVGLGRSALYFVGGKGTVVAVDGKAVGVSFESDAQEQDISLPTGLLFGNTVRDATGLISGDAFPNSQQFNEVSIELNRTIESTILPSLKSQAKVGDTIHFVGCAEVTVVPRDITPLKVVPLQITLEQSP